MLTQLFSQVSIHPQLVIVVPGLLIIGYALKRTPFVKDWMIIWILLFLGVIASVIKLGLSINGIANGIIATGAAISFHQAYKQYQKRGE